MKRTTFTKAASFITAAVMLGSAVAGCASQTRDGRETTGETTEKTITGTDPVSCEITPEAEAAYYEAYSLYDMSPRIPILLLQTEDTAEGPEYTFLESTGTYSYSGMEVYRISSVIPDEQYGHVLGREINLDGVVVGTSEEGDVFNFPDSYEVGPDVTDIDGATPLAVLSVRGGDAVYFCHVEGTVYETVEVGEDGTVTVIMTADLS